MDFARKLLEKYGWSDGKGLGKHENGIPEALKPKLKRSVSGIGHDAASDFTEHWWTTLYNKAAGNVQVEDENGMTKKIKTKDCSTFEITNNTWKLKRKKEAQNEEQYADYFIKKSILTNGGAKTKKVKETDSEDEEADSRDVTKMTDEDLFAACGGRTAHKGARHGLKALGKLARIEQQEQAMLMQDKYNGYSHCKKTKQNISDRELQVVENLNLNSDSETDIKKQRKKKKKCFKNDKNQAESVMAGSSQSVPKRNKKKRKLSVKDQNEENSDQVTIEEAEEFKTKSNKKKKMTENIEDTDVVAKKKKKLKLL